MLGLVRRDRTLVVGVTQQAGAKKGPVVMVV